MSMKKIPRTPLHFFLLVTKKFSLWASLATTAVVVAAAGSVYLRLMIEEIVNAIESNGIETVLLYGLLYPVVYFVISVVWRISGVTGSYWLLGAPKESTDLLSEYSTHHSHGYFSNRFAGSLSNKISNVSRSMEDFVATFLWSFLENFIPILLTAMVFWSTDPVIGAAFVGLVIVSLVLNIILLPRKRRLSLALAAAQSKTTGFLVDVIANISAVRQFSHSARELKEIQVHTNDVLKKGKKSFLYSEYTMLVNSLVFTTFALFMFITLTEKWVEGEITSGRLVSFILLITYTSGTFVMLGRIVGHIAKVYGQAEEGLNELSVPHEITDAPNAKNLKVQKAEIVWQDVDFSYEEQQVFKSFNLTIEPGQRVGLVGQSGAGKTTFVSLLLRQHDIDGGEIMIDGQNIATVTQDSLRKNIAVVPQEPLLFHRSIKENILYGKPNATKKEMIEVAKKAQAHDFIMALPDGYDTLVGERGVKLSGGQKQRVAIARAMLKDAPILVLDEATSALDSESEVAIQKALESLMKGKTVIAVAHRLSTLRKMDRILVMEDGKIIEDGSHDKLAQADGTYQKLWQHQAGGFLQE